MFDVRCDTHKLWVLVELREIFWGFFSREIAANERRDNDVFRFIICSYLYSRNATILAAFVILGFLIPKLINRSIVIFIGMYC